MKKTFFLLFFGVTLQFLPLTVIYQAQANHCSDSSQHTKTLPENYHCHGKAQNTNDMDCHDHSGGLTAHKHSTESQSESKSSTSEK